MDITYKGDDTRAFGWDFITITLSNPDLYKISKIIFVINGTIQKVFKDVNFFQRETITLTVNLTSDETVKLLPSNIGRLVIYDENGYQLTCPESVTFPAQNGVIYDTKQYSCRLHN